VTIMTDGLYYEPNRRRRARESAVVFPTPAEVAERAYELFVSQGRRCEDADEYWARAEQELLDRAARRATR